MISVFKQKWRIALATVALGSIALSGTAFAQNTASGVTITNTATVNYSVASISQTPISAVAAFVVDTVIDLNVTPVASAVTFTPGQTGVAKAFTVSDHTEATRLVQSDAGGVLRKDAGLERPDPRLFRVANQPLEK